MLRICCILLRSAAFAEFVAEACCCWLRPAVVLEICCILLRSAAFVDLCHVRESAALWQKIGRELSSMRVFHPVILDRFVVFRGQMRFMEMLIVEI